MTVVFALLAPLLMVFHLVGPVPPISVCPTGKLSPCTSPAHCARQTWSSSSP